MHYFHLEKHFYQKLSCSPPLNHYRHSRTPPAPTSFKPLPGRQRTDHRTGNPRRCGTPALQVLAIWPWACAGCLPDYLSLTPGTQKRVIARCVPCMPSVSTSAHTTDLKFSTRVRLRSRKRTERAGPTQCHMRLSLRPSYSPHIPPLLIRSSSVDLALAIALDGCLLRYLSRYAHVALAP